MHPLRDAKQKSFSVHAATASEAAWTDVEGKKNAAQQLLQQERCLERGNIGRPT